MNARLMWACLLAFLPCTPVVADGAPAWVLRLERARAAADGRAQASAPAGFAMEVRTASLAAVGATEPRAEPSCLLGRKDAARLSSSRCLECHGTGFGAHTSHPVDVDYEGARGGPHGSLRTLDEAVRRGAFVPEGQVRCTSCHDARSRFAHHVALPPGVEIRLAVRAGEAPTYEPAAPPLMGASDGDEVAVRPLCLTCHPME